MNSHSEQPTFCHRCGAILVAGKGDFYVVNIEAYADPTGPQISAQDLEIDTSAEIRKLIEQTSDMSPTDMMETVYRRLTIHLCGRCYKPWIENPAGKPAD